VRAEDWLQVAAQLAQPAGSADAVTLHPASIERYAADVARLADLTASQTEFSESAELTATLRRLVQSVIVHAEPNAQGFSVEIKGRLAELSGASGAFPSRSRGG
jgi:hypothetical protein